MNIYIKNGALSFVLVGLLALPVLGFNFVKLEERESEVLGLSTNFDLFSKEAKSVLVEGSDLVNLSEELELTLNFAIDAKEQIFFDVIPTDLLNNYQFYLEPSAELASVANVTLQINKDKANLVVKFKNSPTLKSAKTKILVFKKNN